MSYKPAAFFLPSESATRVLPRASPGYTVGLLSKGNSEAVLFNLDKLTHSRAPRRKVASRFVVFLIK